MNSVRTVSTTKAAFQAAYPRPIASVYRRVVEELLVELHLVTVQSTFVYDPFFALGFVTIYDALMEAYQPDSQREAIFAALCRALQLKPEVLRQNASTLLDLVKSGDPQQRLQLLRLQPEASDVGGLRAMLERIGQPNTYTYNRMMLVGLYTCFETVAASLYSDLEERVRAFIETVIQPLHLSKERVKKDLELYHNSLDRMKQARAVVEEMVKAARRQQERRNASAAVVKAEVPSSSEAPTNDARE